MHSDEGGEGGGPVCGTGGVTIHPIKQPGSYQVRVPSPDQRLLGGWGWG
jgi:hypothetical protein